MLLVSAPFLFGCMPSAYDVDTLGPQADPSRFAFDAAFCRENADLYRAKPTVGSVASAGIQGGAGALSYWPINPGIPVLGAAGGAGYEAQKGFDLTGQVRRSVYFNCMKDLTNRDQSAVVADPRP